MNGIEPTGDAINRVRIGTLEIAYHSTGPENGSPIVLLHGFPYDVHCFDEVVPGLAEAGNRAIVPYMRGYGETRFIDKDVPRVGQQAAFADLVGLIDGLGIERATLAGFDWGGRAACVVAALHPDRVSGLVSGGSGYNIQNSDDASKPVDPATEQRS